MLLALTLTLILVKCLRIMCMSKLQESSRHFSPLPSSSFPSSEDVYTCAHICFTQLQEGSQYFSLFLYLLTPSS